MQIDDFLSLVKKRRSIRRLKPDPIPDEYLYKILESARWAMSGANAQPWEFIIVKDKETKQKMAEGWLQIREDNYNVIEQTRIEKLRHPMFARPLTLPNFVYAPVIIVVCGDRRTLQATILAPSFIGAEGSKSGDATYLKNMANTTQIMHLAAASAGLGSTWISVNGIFEQLLKTILEVPPAIDIHSMVALGHPAYEPAPTFRRELEEIVHYEKYDKSKYRTGADVISFIRLIRRYLHEQNKPAYKPNST